MPKYKHFIHRKQFYILIRPTNSLLRSLMASKLRSVSINR